MKYSILISDTNDFESGWTIKKVQEKIQLILEENKGKVFLITMEEVEELRDY